MNKDHINCLWEMQFLSRARPNFKGKPQLKLGHGWIITFQRNFITTTEVRARSRSYIGQKTTNVIIYPRPDLRWIQISNFISKRWSYIYVSWDCKWWLGMEFVISKVLDSAIGNRISLFFLIRLALYNLGGKYICYLLGALTDKD